MFSAIGEKTLYIFGACNVISIPMVWALYPESNQRTLEQMDMLFASSSWWVWEAEKEFARLQEENPELAYAARRGSRVVDPETGLRRASTKVSGKGPSLDVPANGGKNGIAHGFSGEKIEA